jgi:hypothetical protein
MAWEEFPHSLGHQRTLGRSTETSPFAPSTDIGGQSDHFRKVPIGDIARLLETKEAAH